MKPAIIATFAFVVFLFSSLAHGGEPFDQADIESMMAKAKLDAMLEHYKSLIAERLDTLAEIEILDAQSIDSRARKKAAEEKAQVLAGLIASTEEEIKRSGRKYNQLLARFGSEIEDTAVNSALRSDLLRHAAMLKLELIENELNLGPEHPQIKVLHAKIEAINHQLALLGK